MGELIPAITVPVHARNRVEWVLGEQLLLPALAERAGVDLVHSLGNTAPAWGDFRRVVTIHDLAYRLAPDAHAGVLGLGMRVLVPLAAHRSHRIMVDTANTGADLDRLLRIPPGKVDVVPLGLGTARRAAPLPEPDLRARLGLGEGTLVLCAAAKRPHKNLMRLLGALALIPPDAGRRSYCPATAPRTRMRYGSARSSSTSQPMCASSGGSIPASSRAYTRPRPASCSRR